MSRKAGYNHVTYFWELSLPSSARRLSLLISLSKDLVLTWILTLVFVLMADQSRVQGYLPKEFPWAIVGCPAWMQSGEDLRSNIPLGIPCACFVPGGHHGAAEADLQDEAGALQLQT